MVIKIISIFLSLFIFVSCTETQSISGKWKLNIKIQEQELPVVIDIVQNEDKLTARLFNSSEILNLSGSFINNSFILELDTGHAELRGKLVGDKLEGKWIRTNKDDYKIDFTAQRTANEHLFQKYEKHTNLINVTGKWKVNFEKEKYGLGVFSQKGSRVQGSILTETGDYRFLDGFLENNELKLYGFDGVFSFVVTLAIKENLFQGTMYSGQSYSETISGGKDDLFTLADPTEITKVTTEKALELKLPNLAGELIDISDGDYKNKGKVIQLFGTWCPNCIDETHFFLEWRKNNISKLNNVKFVAVSFERTKTKKEALKNLKKLKSKMNIDYDIVLADFDKTKKVTDFFPIDKLRAFPTTIFLDKDNKIIKIHTGFSGQATGEFFDNFKLDFNKTIDELIK